MHHLCLHLWSILSIVGINIINNIITIIIINETLLSSVVVLTVQYYRHDSDIKWLCQRTIMWQFMTRFIGNVVTYTATQATQQRCNIWSVQVWITHDTQYAYCVQQVLQRCDVLVNKVYSYYIIRTMYKRIECNGFMALCIVWSDISEGEYALVNIIWDLLTARLR